MLSLMLIVILLHALRINAVTDHVALRIDAVTNAHSNTATCSFRINAVTLMLHSNAAITLLYSNTATLMQSPHAS